MDQPITVTTDTHYMTREFLESQLVQNKTRIDQLEEHIQKVTQRSYADSAERNRITEDMQTWTLKALEEGTINESEAEEMIANAEDAAERAMEDKKREVAALAQAARREGERIISGATAEVSNYRQWLSSVISEAERLYRIQTQSLDAAENAIHQSRSRLEVAFNRLADLQKSVLDNLNPDDTVINRGPIRVQSQRTKAALDAPKSKSTKKVAKKSSAKRK